MKLTLKCGAVLSAVLLYAGVLRAQTMNPIPGTPNLNPSKGGSFTFLVAGDNRPAKAGDSQPATPGLIMAEAKSKGASFIVWTGDMISGLDSADPKEINKEYQGFFKIAATAGVPVFASPGNHEMDVKVKHDKDLKEKGSQAMEDLYRAAMGIANKGAIYGAFTYGNSTFILVNTEEIAPANAVRSAGAMVTDETTGAKINLDPGYISPAQMTWITNELAANKSAHTFIFMHHPIKPLKPTMGLNQSNADALMQLFAKYTNISYVMASHEHLYYNPQGPGTGQPPKRTDPSKNPPYYVVSGGAGAPLDKGSPGAFNNYLEVTVNGNDIDVKMHQLPPPKSK